MATDGRMRAAALLLGFLITAAHADDRCAAPTEITAVANPQDGRVIHASTTYAVAGYASGKKSYLVFEAAATGEHTLALGGASVGVRIIDEPPTQIRAAKDCMHTLATNVLVAGERYAIELGALPAAQKVLLRIDAPVEEDHVAIVLRK